jgi:hypothetical protein
MKNLRNLTLIRASAMASVALIGFALSSQYAFAQATYNYTGGPLGSLIPPFTTSMHVSATLQLGSWLPPNQHCIYVSSLPGFRLIMSDGPDTVDTDLLSASAAVALVSTDSQGQITFPWLVSLGSMGSDLGGQTCLPSDILDAYDWADGSLEEGPPGHWSYPSASALTIMLTNEINLQQIGPGRSLSNKLTQIRNDITTNNGYGCSDLVNFASAVKAQTGKKLTADQSTFILHTVTIMQSELSCGG